MARRRVSARRSPYKRVWRSFTIVLHVKNSAARNRIGNLSHVRAAWGAGREVGRAGWVRPGRASGDSGGMDGEGCVMRIGHVRVCGWVCMCVYVRWSDVPEPQLSPTRVFGSNLSAWLPRVDTTMSFCDALFPKAASAEPPVKRQRLEMAETQDQSQLLETLPEEQVKRQRMETLPEEPAKRHKQEPLDDAAQTGITVPPSTPTTTADSQQNEGTSPTRASDDEPLGNPAASLPSSVATSSTGDSQGSDAAPTGTAPSATAADILGGSGDLCDMCHTAGPLKPCGAGKLLKMRCESCDYGYTHLTKRVKPPEIQKNKAHLMNDPAGFAQLCNSEGRIHLQVYGEMRDKGVAVNSIAGKEYKARRIGELRQEVSMTREVRREGPGLKILPERAWIAHTKNTEGYDRVLDGVEEAKIMWDSAVLCNSLMKNEYGEWGLPVLVRGKTQTADIISKTAKFSQKDDVTDENREAMDAKLITPLVGPAAHGDGLYKQVGGNQLMSGVCPASYAPAVATQDSRGTLSSLRCVRLLDPQK